MITTQIILIIIFTLYIIFKPSLDINRINGDLLLWYTIKNRRYNIVLIYNFYKPKDE